MRLAKRKDTPLAMLAANLLKYAPSLTLWDVDKQRAAHKLQYGDNDDIYTEEELQQRKESKKKRRKNDDKRATHEIARF